MNDLIETIFAEFTVNSKAIPVRFMYYHGHGEPYITYMLEATDSVFSADDEIQKYVEHYDFDVYAKSTFFEIIESMKEKLEANGFTWEPSRSSIDFYEVDTGYYHRTLSFAYIRREN